MIDSSPSPLSPASQPDKQASESARAFLNLHHLRNRITEGINANLPRKTVLFEIVHTVLREGLAQGALLTFLPWVGRDPEELVGNFDNVGARWTDMRGKTPIKEAHAGRRVHWSVEAGDPVREEACFSFCFSTNGKGAIALTGIGSPKADHLFHLKGFFSTEVENLLIRDQVLRAGGPGEPLKDMAEWTRLTLDAADAILGQLASSPGGSAMQMAAQTKLLAAIRELTHYTHIDEGLAELSSSLLVVTHEVHKGPFSAPQLEAIRGVLQRMRAIALSDSDVEQCLDCLESAGLDIYDAFGEDERDADLA